MKKEEKKKDSRNKVGLILIILLILTFISGELLATRLIEYVNRDDREVLLQSNFDGNMELFSVRYKNEIGEIVVSGADGQNVIAPGTNVDYTIRLRNRDKVAIDYTLSPEAVFSSEYIVPILFRLVDSDGSYIIGDEKNWATAEEITKFSEKRTIRKGETQEFIFQWKWEFESENDEYDTFLGSASPTEDIGIKVKLNVKAKANTNIGVNGGIIGSGLGEIIAMGLWLILLIIAVIILMIYLLKKRKNEGV